MAKKKAKKKAAKKSAPKKTPAKKAVKKKTAKKGPAPKSAAKAPKKKAKKAPKKAAKKRPARELIDTGVDKRYVRRDDEGQFAESDDVGRSLSQDIRQHAAADAPPGQGDMGD